jgi:hypothetical protein
VIAHPALPPYPFPHVSRFRSARRPARVLLACAALLACLCAPGPARAEDSPVAVFDSVVAEVRARFFDPALLGAHFDSSVSDRRSVLQAAGASANVEAQVRGLLQELRCSGSRFYREGQAPDLTPAFQWRETLDGVVVQRVQRGSDCERAGLARGDFLLTHVSELWGPTGSRLTLRVRSTDGVEWSQPVRREGFTSTDPDLGWNSFFGKVGYLKVNRLHDPMVVDTAMRRVRPFPDLILDVRGCSDADPAVLHLLSYFALQAGSAGFAANRAGIEALGGPLVKSLPRGTAENTGSPWTFLPTLTEKGLVELRVLPSVDSSYTGRVVVLTDENTAGFAELVPAWFQSTKRGKVVGRATAGRGGLPVTLRTATGWTLELPAAALFLPDGHPLEVQGVEPTNRMKWRQVDVRSGADPDVERALQVLDIEQ